MNVAYFTLEKTVRVTSYVSFLEIFGSNTFVNHEQKAMYLDVNEQNVCKNIKRSLIYIFYDKGITNEVVFFSSSTMHMML